MKLAAGLFTTEHSGTTSTGLLLGGTLTFTPSQWRLSNTGTLPVYLSLNTTAATTDSERVAPGVSVTFQVPSSVYSVFSTSTSTDGSDLTRFNLSASGG